MAIDLESWGDILHLGIRPDLGPRIAAASSAVKKWTKKWKSLFPNPTKEDGGPYDKEHTYRQYQQSAELDKKETDLTSDFLKIIEVHSDMLKFADLTSLEFDEWHADYGPAHLYIKGIWQETGKEGYRRVRTFTEIAENLRPIVMQGQPDPSEESVQEQITKLLTPMIREQLRGMNG
jgi:hypothetical protein